MAAIDDLNRDIDVDLGGIFASIWRNKFKILLASLLLTVLAFFVVQSISPRYRSEARILIRTGDPILTSPSTTGNPENLNLDDSGIASKVQLLQSRSIAAKIIDALDLKSVPEFDSQLKRSSFDRIVSLLGLSDDGGAVTANDRVMESYFDKLTVFQAEGSRVIVVQFWSKNPKLAAAVPNMVATEYLALQKRLKRGAEPAELEKLQAELATLSTSVKQGETAMAEFRSDKDLLQGRNNNSLATQELSELATELGRVRSQLSRAKANAASVQRALNSGSLDAASSVLQSALIQRLRERQITLGTQLSDLQTTLLPAHPRIRSTRSQMASIDTQIQREARKIGKSLQAEARIAQDREKDLLVRRNELKDEAARVGKEQVELQEMERELVAKRQLLSQYTIRLKEAKSRQAREFLPADAYVFSKASVPSKSYFPKKLPTLFGTFFGTFLLGSMISLVGSVLSGSDVRSRVLEQQVQFDDPEALAENTAQIVSPKTVSHAAKPNFSPSASPPLAPEMSSLVGTSPPISPPSPPPVKNGQYSVAIVAESLKMLGKGRAIILSPEADGGLNCSALLARALSGQGATVIVLDMSGSGGATKMMLKTPDLPGIKDMLGQTASIANAIHRDNTSAAHIMPTGQLSNKLAAQNAERLPALLQILQEAYEFVLVDCGSTGIGGLKRVSDSNSVNIIAAGSADSPGVKLLANKLERAGYHTPLIVLTGSSQNELSSTNAA